MLASRQSCHNHKSVRFACAVASSHMVDLGPSTSCPRCQTQWNVADAKRLPTPTTGERAMTIRRRRRRREEAGGGEKAGTRCAAPRTRSEESEDPNPQGGQDQRRMRLPSSTRRWTTTQTHAPSLLARDIGREHDD
ncbi:unnamed protein product [Prorocentrum cordatum]|uniref:Uncharacterized protein n=1 Tax=Prorocentrum cordatum TaxID=2364126 RepID=A0ABN9VES5_9DINO|nr:unnamed protein product [Polarella glacialis]